MNIYKFKIKLQMFDNLSSSWKKAFKVLKDRQNAEINVAETIKEIRDSNRCEC